MSTSAEVVEESRSPTANVPRSISLSPGWDVALICFPIWVPAAFVLSQRLSADVAAPIVFAAFFVLRELHFGATWLFFFNADNRRWLMKRPRVALLFPLLILAALWLVLQTRGFDAAFFLTNVASWYHVTRQSVGMSRLYSEGDTGAYRSVSTAIYVLSTAFLLVGYVRFYAGIELSSSALGWLTIGGAAACVAPFIALWLRLRQAGRSARFHLVGLTGMLIYYPYCFVTTAEDALLIGVGMHWLQYLSLVLPIYARRARSSGSRAAGEPVGFLQQVLDQPAYVASFLLVYVIAVFLLNAWGRTSGGGVALVASFLVLGAYNLHFYYEAFLWRFSDPHIRSAIGAYVFRSAGQ